MEQTRACAWCGEKFSATTAQKTKRFCGTSCSAKWRMRQPEIVAKVHSPEVAAKRGRLKAAWFQAGSPKALAEIKRIRLMNPMTNPKTRAKVSAALRAMGHGPSVRGGNGRGPTVAQRALWEALGPGWYLEYPISLGRKTRGYPTAYKVDIANPTWMLAVEVDGASHHSRKALDAKKDTALAGLGWKVLRFWNREVLSSARSVADTIRSASTISK